MVILDRDGVINQDSDAFIKSPEEWLPIPGSLEAIATLGNAGFTVAVATNQSGIARGLFDIDTLGAIHQQMMRRLADLGGHVDAIAFCPHGPGDGCRCRKPAPGLLLELGRRLGRPLAGVPVVGDSLRDLEAAVGVGASPILVRTGKGRRTEQTLPETLAGIPIADDLQAAVDLILRTYPDPAR
ncbi:D-glycero-beta-D-manno-heptose 1,7-bisphosphate 7-phosphatase [Thiohalocapsa marina]|uniref:D,D-heptose 1,7-bisphosphate phosphatase n=1 Tax=Thiohalocapsa marina TaxID=424902 RepID=A0A5M8FUK0_9GAMM|nr:D-glycero-beta-D-manno-heptose 1,7-bisphosphate 7-phosphatase [Thiohalocapsa marina]KAA6187480.1 D-glycero-beta-D-manno-heptose 1,7-bisphosphate 7-phosphatase [Thiohalocapsa marina]